MSSNYLFVFENVIIIAKTWVQIIFLYCIISLVLVYTKITIYLSPNRTWNIRPTTTIHLTLMTSAQVVDASVTTTNNIPQGNTHLDDQITLSHLHIPPCRVTSGIHH